ncbi:MAG: hypothetical protein K2F92_04065, partial [Alistipes sp.]|nr:hypothetical protein [Alistipes sp.]
PNNSIQENNFDKLYKDVIAIATLCTLYSNILGQSSLNTETKIVFSNVIKIHAENAWRLFVLYKDQNINIINASSDIWERYVKNEELEAKLKDIIKE